MTYICLWRVFYIYCISIHKAALQLWICWHLGLVTLPTRMPFCLKNALCFKSGFHWRLFGSLLFVVEFGTYKNQNKQCDQFVKWKQLLKPKTNNKKQQRAAKGRCPFWISSLDIRTSNNEQQNKTKNIFHSQKLLCHWLHAKFWPLKGRWLRSRAMKNEKEQERAMRRNKGNKEHRSETKKQNIGVGKKSKQAMKNPNKQQRAKKLQIETVFNSNSRVFFVMAIASTVNALQAPTQIRRYITVKQCVDSYPKRCCLFGKDQQQSIAVVFFFWGGGGD